MMISQHFSASPPLWHGLVSGSQTVGVGDCREEEPAGLAAGNDLSFSRRRRGCPRALSAGL